MAIATIELRWLHSLVRDIVVQCNNIPILYCNNNSALHMIGNPIFHARSKFFEFDVHFI